MPGDCLLCAARISVYCFLYFYIGSILSAGRYKYMLSSILWFAFIMVSLCGPVAMPPTIILAGLAIVLYGRNQQYAWLDPANMHTFTTNYIIATIARYPVTANTDTYSRLYRELGNRFSRRADLLSAAVRQCTFQGRYFAELPFCNRPWLRAVLIRSGMYLRIRTVACCLGLLRGSMLAEYHLHYLHGRKYNALPPRLTGCIDTLLAESNTAAVLMLHEPLAFVVCAVCHPPQCTPDRECPGDAQIHTSWTAWQNNAGQAADDCAQLSNDDTRRAATIGATIHRLHDAAAYTSRRHILIVCVAIYMPVIITAAYLMRCIL